MDVSKYQELIAMLRDQGVEYFRDGDMELRLYPKQVVVPQAQEKMPEPLPEVFKKLPANYSHPSLTKFR